MAVRVYTGQFALDNLPWSYPVHFVALSAAGAPVTGLAGAFTVRAMQTHQGASTDITGAVTITEPDAANMPGHYEMTLDTATVGYPGPVSFKITNAGIDEIRLIFMLLPRESVLVG